MDSPRHFRNIPIQIRPPRFTRPPSENHRDCRGTAPGAAIRVRHLRTFRHRQCQTTHVLTRRPWFRAPVRIAEGHREIGPQDGQHNPRNAAAGTDVRHIASINALWDIPFARQNRWLGGWKLSGLAMLRSGIALNVTQPVNTFGSDNAANQRPDRVLGVSPYAANPTPDFWLNPAAFAAAPRGRVGTSGRNPLSGPGFVQTDISLLKDFRLRESWKVQFRTEAFNVLNRPNFAQPNTVAGTPNYGRIFNTLGRTIGSGTSRQIQLVVRFEF